MRVTRRARPPQVGFAASIGRRRLLHTHTTAAHETPSGQPEPGLKWVIQLDFRDVEPSVTNAPGVSPTGLVDSHRFVASGSSARGR
jgi:hypothetical protein